MKNSKLKKKMSLDDYFSLNFSFKKQEASTSSNSDK